MTKTSNHGYNVPERGEQNWNVPLNENFEAHDSDIELRDEAANRDDYEPKEGAKFLATDTGVVSVGDGSSWTEALALPRYVPPKDSAGSVVLGHPSNAVEAGTNGATIAGGGLDGDANTVSAGSHFAAIGGGYHNTGNGLGTTIGGGSNNGIRGSYGAIGGGRENRALANFGVVAGGDANVASGPISTVGGGSDNVADGDGATVGGGSENEASGYIATVAGGEENIAAGSHSFAAGHNAKAKADGAFVWGDSTDQNVASTQANEFKVQAGGGAVVFSASDLSAGVNLSPGSGSWTAWSSRAAKENVASVDPGEVLDGVNDLDVNTWNYRSQDENVRHMGPMAEEFAASFELGPDDEHIVNVDADGVAFAAIQGLSERLAAERARVDELETTVADQRDETESLRDELDSLRAEVAALREDREDDASE